MFCRNERVGVRQSTIGQDRDLQTREVAHAGQQVIEDIERASLNRT